MVLVVGPTASRDGGFWRRGVTIRRPSIAELAVEPRFKNNKSTGSRNKNGGQKISYVRQASRRFV